MTREGGPVPHDVLEACLDRLSAGSGHVDARRLGGGCIHPAVRLRTAGGREAFLKWSSSPGPAPFGVEARGLGALAERGGVRIPEVLGFDDGSDDTRGWLLLEFLPPSPEPPDFGARLGRGLARLHRTLEERPGAGTPRPGWEEDGWIGSLPQENRPRDGWPRFWGEARLLPQLRLAHGHLPSGDARKVERLVDQLDDALAGWEVDGISLLHGDLWSGNVLVTGGGDPALVDPAVYRGHGEVDLAMLELFGDPPAGLLEQYGEVRPLSPAYREVRRDVYQLYPLLVHVNLFGGAYVAGARAAAERALSALGA